MKAASNEELQKKLAGHQGRREVITIEFPEVGYEIAFRPATPDEYKAWIGNDNKQPTSSARFTLLASCLLFPDVGTISALAEQLPALVAECTTEIDEAGGPGEMLVFDLNEATLPKLSKVDVTQARSLMKAQRATKGVIVRMGESDETHFALKAPPRATYDDVDDARDAAGVRDASERAALDCMTLIAPEARAALLDKYPGIPTMLLRHIRALGGEGTKRKKARRVV